MALLVFRRGEGGGGGHAAVAESTSAVVPCCAMLCRAGGVMEAAVRTVYEIVTGKDMPIMKVSRGWGHHVITRGYCPGPRHEDLDT